MVDWVIYSIPSDIQILYKDKDHKLKLMKYRSIYRDCNRTTTGGAVIIKSKLLNLAERNFITRSV